MLTPDGLRIIVESGRSVESLINKTEAPKKDTPSSLPRSETIFEAGNPQPDTSFIEMLTEAEISL